MTLDVLLYTIFYLVCFFNSMDFTNENIQMLELPFGGCVWKEIVLEKTSF